jgi:hypothetical protein
VTKGKIIYSHAASPREDRHLPIRRLSLVAVHWPYLLHGRNVLGQQSPTNQATIVPQSGDGHAPIGRRSCPNRATAGRSLTKYQIKHEIRIFTRTPSLEDAEIINLISNYDEDSHSCLNFGFDAVQNMIQSVKFPNTIKRDIHIVNPNLKLILTFTPHGNSLFSYGLNLRYISTFYPI